MASTRATCGADVLHIVATVGGAPEDLASTHDVAATGRVLHQLALDHREDRIVRAGFGARISAMVAHLQVGR